MHQLISSLISHGKILASLKKKANQKSKQGLNAEGINSNVKKEAENAVKSLLSEFNTAYSEGMFYSDVDSASALHVLQAIEDTLRKFWQFEPDDEIAKEVTDLRRRVQSPAGGSLEISELNDPSCFTSKQELSDVEVSEKIEKLTPNERQCVMYLYLFKEMKKRELILWWVGTDLIKDPLEGDEVLDKLVAEGFIDPVIGSRKIYNKYKIPDNSCDACRRALEPPGLRQHILLLKGFVDKEDETNKWESIHSLINTETDVLRGKTLESLSKVKNIQLLVLGSSPGPSNRLIELERVEKLDAALKRLKNVKCLSLQGISGIVVLPRSVYKLKKLKVLDLRACYDLTKVPRGITSLQQLTHLDMSKCYMLDYIPVGISNLQQLVVLKGFIINDSTGSEVNGSCNFSDLSSLQELTTLSIRTRRMNFPTEEDLQILDEMAQLNNLRIAWVGRPDTTIGREIKSTANVFPKSLRKIELQAAPAQTASSLLGLIKQQTTLEKLYIKGGQLWEFGQGEPVEFAHVKLLRLRYLSKLHCTWSDFQKMFPNLTRLETFQCPNLIFFPCDEDGVWEYLD